MSSLVTVDALMVLSSERATIIVGVWIEGLTFVTRCENDRVARCYVTGGTEIPPSVDEVRLSEDANGPAEFIASEADKVEAGPKRHQIG